MKAIKITSDAQGSLVIKFNQETEEKDEIFPLGYIVVTDFGNDETFVVLTPEVFNQYYAWGDAIQNGWFDIVGGDS